MPNVAVNVAVIHEGKILLTKRDDFQIWCLPSGGVEEGESLAEAAIRETKEETGIDVELTRLVGVYSRLGVFGLPDGHAVLYEGRPIGGELTLQPGETIDVRYFAFDEIPSELAFAHRQRIADAIKGIQGVSVRQQIKFPERLAYSRKELLELMKMSSLSPAEFYMQRIKDAEIIEVIEVGHP
jgi:ADP-ribose pyrophosphatase YjhB (NUDIX family)